MNIGEKIRKVRMLKGFSQDYVASQIGLKQNTLSKIESGEINIAFERLEQIAKLFDLDIQDLLSFDDKYIFNNNNILNDNSKMVNVSNYDENQIKLLNETIDALKRENDAYRSILKKNKLI